MKIWLNIYSDFDNGNLFAEELAGQLKHLPRIGDFISIESFFPAFISESWEIENKIQPFGEVTCVVFHKDAIHIDIKA